MNDTAHIRPSRHQFRNSQSSFRNASLFLDEQLPRLIRALQQIPQPAFPLRAANQQLTVITNSLLCKGEWRSYCRSKDTPCLFRVTRNNIYFKDNCSSWTAPEKTPRFSAGLWRLHVGSLRLLDLDAILVGGCGTPRGLDAITRTRYAAAQVTKNRHPRVQIRRWVTTTTWHRVCLFVCVWKVK